MVILNSLLEREGRSCVDGELPGFQSGPVVDAEHRIHGEQIEQPILDHLTRAAATLFRWLEYQVHGAVEVSVLRQVLRSG